MYSLSTIKHQVINVFIMTTPNENAEQGDSSAFSLVSAIIMLPGEQEEVQ